MEKKIKRLEYQFIKCPDLPTARDAYDVVKNELKNERNLDTLSIVSKKEFYEDVENYYLTILTNEYKLKEIKDLLKKFIFTYKWN